MIVSKTLPVSIMIATSIKYWYLLGMSRWEKLCLTQIINWVNAILSHSNTRMIFLGYQGSCMVFIHEWYRKHKIMSNTHTLLVQQIVKCSFLGYSNGMKKRWHQSNIGFMSQGHKGLPSPTWGHSSLKVTCMQNPLSITPYIQSCHDQKEDYSYYRL